MSHPQSPNLAKLVIGFFANEKTLIHEVAAELKTHFGELDLVSSWLPFDYTTYYTREMGTPLFRRMMAFQGLIRQSELPAVKLATNKIEKTFSRAGKRRVNIDPGYLLAERFVLATGKNFSHRIYIGKKIYADLTLIYQKGAFQVLPWTYPDYADRRLQAVLMMIRKRYMAEISGHLNRFDEKNADGDRR